MTAYNVGVIGCGWAGSNRHIPSFQRAESATLSAVYDRNKATATTVAEEHNIKKSFDSLETFLEEPLDVVSICTPPWTHAEIAIQALKAGCHVLTEKPMAMSLTDADEMIEVAEETEMRLGVVHNFLHADSVQRARRLVDSGEVGNVQSVVGLQTSSFRRHLPSWFEELPGGLFFDESPHLLYLIDHFIGPLKVETTTLRQGSSGEATPRHVDATLRGDNERIGSITMLFDAPLSEWYVIVVGTKQILVVDLFRDILLTFDEEESHSARDVIGMSAQAVLQEIRGVASSGIKMMSGSLLFGMGDLVEKYLTALTEGGDLPVNSREGRRTLKNGVDILQRGNIETD